MGKELLRNQTAPPETKAWLISLLICLQVYITESSTSEVTTKLGNAKVISFKYGKVMFFIREGFLDTNSFHSSTSIFPSPFVSASLNVLSTIVSTTSSNSTRSDSCRRAKTISFNSSLSINPVCLRSYNLKANSILLSTGAFG
uniref:Calcineurin B-like protein 4-1 n=1 Tax=Rhizophora mucronata TaxID=61149 RepID=A0A2P2MIU2_RHIMU